MNEIDCFGMVISPGECPERSLEVLYLNLRWISLAFIHSSPITCSMVKSTAQLSIIGIARTSASPSSELLLSDSPDT